jgi:hypothetical protein
MWEGRRDAVARIDWNCGWYQATEGKRVSA